MVQACAQQDSQNHRLCAVDTLEKRIGQPALVKLGVRAEANLELPKAFLDALAECRG